MPTGSILQRQPAGSGPTPKVTGCPLYPAGRGPSRVKVPFALCPRIFTSRGPPRLSGVHTQGPTEGHLRSCVEPPPPRQGQKNAAAVVPGNRISGTCVREFFGFCCWFSFLFLNSRVRITEISTLRPRPPERIETFLKSLRGLHSGGRKHRRPGRARFQVRGQETPTGCDPRAIGPLGGGGARERNPACRTAEPGTGRLETGPRVRSRPDPCALHPASTPGTRRGARPPPLQSPGQVLASRGPRSRPRAPLGSRPRGCASC